MKARYYVIFAAIGIIVIFPVMSIVFYGAVPVGINYRYFENCEECETEFNNTPDQLKGIFGNCECQERVMINPDIIEKCPQPFIDWENSTHYIDNNICEWREK